MTDLIHPENFNNLKRTARVPAWKIEQQLTRIDFQPTARTGGTRRAKTTYQRGDITVVVIVTHQHDDPPTYPEEALDNVPF